jgi:hypothetical protein
MFGKVANVLLGIAADRRQWPLIDGTGMDVRSTVSCMLGPVTWDTARGRGGGPCFLFEVGLAPFGFTSFWWLLQSGFWAM